MRTNLLKKFNIIVIYVKNKKKLLKGSAVYDGYRILMIAMVENKTLWK